MPARFLLGPAGSGKTFRCLAEIRAELAARPDGPPLFLLAPKQATFQLERQLLADAAVQAFTRLRILSFDRLARFLLQELGQPPPALLDEEGRIMVLRALLNRRRDDLQLFRASSRLPGFARQLSALFREFQRHHVSPATLLTIAARHGGDRTFQPKLQDFALLLEACGQWLAQRRLQDADQLLDVATGALKSQIANRQSRIQFGALWLDGFAEMTPQELELLATVLPLCERVTAAFCLEDIPRDDLPWLSTWSAIAQTFRRCRQRLASIEGLQVDVEILPRQSGQTRFIKAELSHLESHWAAPKAFDSAPHTPHPAIEVAACFDAEAEIVHAARSIRRFVREGRGRYRDCAVLLRTLKGYEHTLRRVFTRFDIPFFLDRRESVAHHPLAELTRAALRLAAQGWQHDDWFGALKTGLVTRDTDAVDWLENEALARGWKESFWHQPVALEKEPQLAERAEALRGRWVPPFQRLQTALNAERISGDAMARALRTLWDELSIPATLEEWSRAPLAAAQPGVAALSPAVHATVWDQMQVWLENVERAFHGEALTLREWLPVLDAGLASLSVGVLPPSLDQVLIGAIDRSRNPDLKFTLLPGLNEGVFPARPETPSLLTESDRERLEQHGAGLGLRARQQIGHERYYGYIACTRASERLLVSFSQRDAEGRAINPSPFIAHLQRLFPSLEVRLIAAENDWREAEHVNELAPAIAECGMRNAERGMAKRQDERQVEQENARRDEPCESNEEKAVRISNASQGAIPCEAQPAAARPAPPGRLFELCPPARELAERLRHLQCEAGHARLSPGLAEALHGRVLETSVSRIEQFAACPFKFFVASGLRAEERKQFELDARERGSFQHEVLRMFHEELAGQGLRWRDATPAEARERIGRIAARLAGEYGEGLLAADDAGRFTARSLAAALQDFIEVIVGWMHAGYGFDPARVELAFGKAGDPLPAWVIDLGGGRRMEFRGKIDRVDVAADGERAWVVVVDYKSGGKKIDRQLLEAGVQIQLPAYLAAVLRVADGAALGVNGSLAPAGLCYVNLRGQFDRGQDRQESLGDEATRRALGYQHEARLNFDALRWLDAAARSGGKTGQFGFRLTKSGAPYANDAALKSNNEIQAMLGGVERTLRELGRGIYEGKAGVEPYRKGGQKACDHCDYQAVCRFDPWTQTYRSLSRAGEGSESGDNDA